MNVTNETQAGRTERPLEALVGPGTKRPGAQEPCDMRIGPCACGSWHDESDPGRSLLDDNDYYQPEEAKRPIPAALRKQWGMPEPNDAVTRGAR